MEGCCPFTVSCPTSSLPLPGPTNVHSSDGRRHANLAYTLHIHIRSMFHHLLDERVETVGNRTGMERDPSSHLLVSAIGDSPPTGKNGCTHSW